VGSTSHVKEGALIFPFSKKGNKSTKKSLEEFSANVRKVFLPILKKKGAPAGLVARKKASHGESRSSGRSHLAKGESNIKRKKKSRLGCASRGQQGPSRYAGKREKEGFSALKKKEGVYGGQGEGGGILSSKGRGVREKNMSG